MKKTFDGSTDWTSGAEAQDAGYLGAMNDKDDSGLTGRVLIAAPSLAGTVFERTVIYLCAHSAADGAMGLIVNRRLSQSGLDELFSQLGIEPNPPRRRINLCMGGPVEPKRGFVLHSSDWAGEGSLSVNGEVFLTASLDILREIASGRGPERAVMALGHAAWASGQLEREILQDGSWFVAPATEALMFGAEHSKKWGQALASIDIDPLLFSSLIGEA